MPTTTQATALGTTLAERLKLRLPPNIPSSSATDQARIDSMTALAEGLLTRLEFTLEPAPWLSLSDYLSTGWNTVSGKPPPALRHDLDGWFSLRGLIAGGAIGSVVLTLPIGYRPTVIEKFTCAMGTGYGNVEIYPSGTVQLISASNTTDLSLTNIRFAPAPVAL